MDSGVRSPELEEDGAEVVDLTRHLALAHGHGRKFGEHDRPVTHDRNHAELARDDRFVGRCRNTCGVDTVIGRRTASALKVAEHRGTDFEPMLFNLGRDEVTDASRRVAHAAHAIGQRRAVLTTELGEVDAFGDDHDGKDQSGAATVFEVFERSRPW